MPLFRKRKNNMARRKSIESMEGPTQEKTTQEKLEEIKIADIESMKDNKTYTSPFLHIETKDLTPTALELYSDYENLLAAQNDDKADLSAKLDDAKGSLGELVAEIEKMKEGGVKASNEGFYKWMQKIITLKEQQLDAKNQAEMDNN